MNDLRALRQLMGALAGHVPRRPDWDAMLSLANRTLTTGTLAQALWAHGTAMPDDVRGFLGEVLERVEKRNARLRLQLEEAVGWLDRSGIRPILLKGAASLAGQPAPHGRILSDIDLMVPESQMPAAIRCLERAGYTVIPPFAEPPNPIVLARDSDVGSIDLHARLKSPWPACDYRQLRKICVPHRVQGNMAWLPTPAAQAFVLILHDQLQDRDYWRGLIDLRHLLDLAALAHGPGGIDWQRLAALFPKGHPARALRTQLRTLTRLTDTAVPHDLTRGLWPALQYRRRLAQLRLPFIARATTWLSLAADPPSHPDQASYPADTAQPKRPRWDASRLRRFHRQKAAGKV